MRVIAGKYKSRRLSAARDLSIRPMTDRVKQTLFDILTNRMGLEGAVALDLFSGTGSLGIEALSRGAASVEFVEKNGSSLAVLEKNLRSLSIGGEARIVRGDVFQYLKHVHSPFDLVMADPPYRLAEIGTLPETIFASGAARNGTIVCMEHGSGSKIVVDETKFGVTRKDFGGTILLILETIGKAEAPEGASQ